MDYLFFFFLSGLISVVTPRFGSLRKYAVVYLWFHVTWVSHFHSSDRVKEVSPMYSVTCAN